MLLDPGMVRRSLHREIEGDLDAERLAGGDEAPEILERAESRLDRAMSAMARADGVEAAGLAGLGPDGIIVALAVDLADRMDRRQIHRVEAHRLDVGQARDAILEGGAASRQPALAARHHLVP